MDNAIKETSAILDKEADQILHFDTKGLKKIGESFRNWIEW